MTNVQQAAFPTIHESDPGAIKTVVVPRARDLGGFEVRRALPHQTRQMVGPFIFFDQMGPATFVGDQAIDVRPHPHIGLATVTYLYNGTIRHRDSLGNTQDIEPGAVNWMVAGKGITHSERTPEGLRNSNPHDLFGIQTWVALPQKYEETDPSFTHVPAAELPRLEADGADLTVILGHAYGAKASAPVYSDTLYVDAQLAAGAVLPMPTDHEDRGIYVVEGEVAVGTQTITAGELAVFGHNKQVVIKAGPRGARLMLLGGAVADGPRHIWWNFVASSQDKIEAAKEEWRRGDWDNGRFTLPPNDQDEFIPID